MNLSHIDAILQSHNSQRGNSNHLWANLLRLTFCLSNALNKDVNAVQNRQHLCKMSLFPSTPTGISHILGSNAQYRNFILSNLPKRNCMRHSAGLTDAILSAASLHVSFRVTCGRDINFTCFFKIHKRWIGPWGPENSAILSEKWFTAVNLQAAALSSELRVFGAEFGRSPGSLEYVALHFPGGAAFLKQPPLKLARCLWVLPSNAPTLHAHAHARSHSSCADFSICPILPLLL